MDLNGLPKTGLPYQHFVCKVPESENKRAKNYEEVIIKAKLVRLLFFFFLVAVAHFVFCFMRTHFKLGLANFICYLTSH